MISDVSQYCNTWHLSYSVGKPIPGTLDCNMWAALTECTMISKSQKQWKSDLALKFETWLGELQRYLQNVWPSLEHLKNQCTLVPHTNVSEGQLDIETGDSGIPFAPSHVHLTCLCDCWFHSKYFPMNLIYLSLSSYLLLNVFTLKLSFRNMLHNNFAIL